MEINLSIAPNVNGWISTRPKLDSISYDCVAGEEDLTRLCE